MSNKALIPTMKERFWAKPPATAPSMFAPNTSLRLSQRRKLSGGEQTSTLSKVCV